MKRILFFFKRRFNRYPHFVAIGISSGIVTLGVTYVLTDLLKLWYMFSFVFGALLGWAFNYFMNSKFTFRGHEMERYIRKYLQYISFYIVIGSTNFILVYIFTSLVGWHYLISIIVSGFFISLISFTFNKKVIFEYMD